MGRLFVDAESGERAVRRNLTSRDRLLGFQRDRTRKVDEMLATGLKEELFGALIVNARDGNRFSIVDGGTRFTFLDESDYRGEVPCLVGRVPVEEEPRWFVSLNKLRLPVSKIDEFRAEYIGGHDVAVEIADTLARYGFRIGKSPDITAVTNIRECHTRGVLEEVVQTLDVWSGVEKATNGQLITAVGQFLVKAKQQPVFDQAAWLDRAARTTPTEVLNSAKEVAALRLANGRRSTIGGSMGIRTEGAAVLVAEYNRGRRAARKLDVTPFVYPGMDL